MVANIQVGPGDLPKLGLISRDHFSLKKNIEKDPESCSILKINENLHQGMSFLLNKWRKDQWSMKDEKKKWTRRHFSTPLFSSLPLPTTDTLWDRWGWEISEDLGLVQGHSASCMWGSRVSNPVFKIIVHHSLIATPNWLSCLLKTCGTTVPSSQCTHTELP